tara:strand:+ start:609 stop:809 length:201 start_codon:yes stop_codon:yes gene_type:complete
MIKYIIQLRYIAEQSDLYQVRHMEIETDNIQFSMEQYQRNREPFNWKIVKQSEGEGIIDFYPSVTN